MTTTTEKVTGPDRLTDTELDELQNILDHLHTDHELDNRHYRLFTALILGYDAAWEHIKRTGGTP